MTYRLRGTDSFLRREITWGLTQWKKHAAHLGYLQHHTGHRWESYFGFMSLSQDVGYEYEV
jgi:hypothetical protein